MAATGRIPASLVNKTENIDHKSGHARVLPLPQKVTHSL